MCECAYCNVLPIWVGAHDTCGSVLGYFGHGTRYCRAIILDGETILFETTDEGGNLASLGGIGELLHFMGDKTLPRCYGTHDKPDVKAFEDAYDFALTGLRMVLDLPLGERLCRLKAPSGESWERLMDELQMKVKYPKTREDVECMFGILHPDIARKNEQMRLYKGAAMLDKMSDILSQGTTTETADTVESQQGDKSEVTEEVKTRKAKKKKALLPEAGAHQPDTRFRGPFPSSDGRRGREMGRGASRGVDGSHRVDRSSRKREAASPEDGRNQKQPKSNENKEDVLSSRGDEEDIVDEMKRREEERKLYLALYSVLEKRGFRFLLGGQKVFQAVLKELADQYSG
nr:hypothetical protein I308_06215 [Cryptococcus tetragattii IND107]